MKPITSMVITNNTYGKKKTKERLNTMVYMGSETDCGEKRHA
jgi:hypothetical protein